MDQVALLDEAQEHHLAGGVEVLAAAVLRADTGPEREHLEHVVIVVAGNAELLEIVAALRAAGRFAGGLNGRKQQGDEDRDNRDHDQQLDQREARPCASSWNDLNASTDLLT